MAADKRRINAVQRGCWGLLAGKAGDPAGDVAAVGFVGGSKGCTQGWFFVGEDEDVGDQPDQGGVAEQMHICKQESLAEDGGYDGYVHGIADVAIQSGDDEVARWKNWSGGAQALECEAGEGIEEDQRS